MGVRLEGGEEETAKNPRVERKRLRNKWLEAADLEDQSVAMEAVEAVR